MKTLDIVLFMLLFVSLLGCSDSTTPELKSSDQPELELPDSSHFKFPAPPKLQKGCDWVTAKSPVFNSKTKFVKSRCKSCLGPESESVFVTHGGNGVTKLTFDIVDGGFSIFESNNIEQEEFVQKMMQKDSEHDGNCVLLKIVENVWKIDDGKGHDADINFMPCGRYGRNFAGETFLL